MTERQMEILRELNACRGKQDGFCTLHSLSEKLNVSQRTVSADLAAIKSWLQGFAGQAQLESKRGTGIRILTNDQTWDRICRFGGISESADLPEISVNYRIVRRILMKKRVRCSDIQEQFFLSKHQLKAALTNVEFFLGSIGIPMQIRPGSGIHIYCDRFQWRAAFWRLYLGMEAELQEERGSSDDTTQRLVSLLLPGLDIGSICQVLSRLEETFHIYFTSDSRKKLILYAAMAVTGYPKHLEAPGPDPGKQSEYIGNRVERQMADYLTDGLSVSYRKNLDGERGCFTRQLELAEWIPKYEQSGNDADPALQKLASQLITWFSGCMHTDCSGDVRLKQALLFYLRPMVHHLEYRQSMPVPFGHEIIRRHTFLYMMCLSQTQKLEELIGCGMQSNELIGLTQIFGNAWLRVVHTVRSVLVCDLNYAACQGVREQIERLVPDILIESVMPSAQRNRLTAYKGDLIILCGVDEKRPYPGTTIRVGVFPQKADVVRLQRACEKVRRGDAESSYALGQPQSQAPRLFDRRIILTDCTVKTKDEILEKLCGLLTQAGYVTAGFFSTVISREMQETTEIGNGFAMPHGSAAAVKRSAVAVALLSRSVLWSENTYVDKIFLIAADINDNAYTMALHDFYHALSLLTDNTEQCMRLMDIHEPGELEIFLNNL